jgi:predicted permease
MRKFLRRIHFLLHRRHLERELAEEMAAHAEMMPADRRLQFGNATRLREESREVWALLWLERLWQDLSHGARVLGRSPGFTLGAVAVLSLGVGVNLAEFQVFDAMIFRSLDIRDADSVLRIARNSRGRPLDFPHGAVELYQANSRSFAWLISEDATFDVVVERSAAVRAALVSPDYFGRLGLAPAWGRLIDFNDAQPGAEPVAALGYDYWRNSWAADPNVIGRVIRINNRPVRIAGVLPYTFPRSLLGRRIEVWFPISMRPFLMAGTPALQHDFSRPSESLFGKLSPGVSQLAGEAELTSLTRELAREQPRYFQDDERLQGQLVRQTILQAVRSQPGIAVFFVIMLLVLLSACANLGNMLLARGLVRQREIDIRIAIGAGSARVLRQLMTENFLLALLGSAAGLGFGAIAVRLLLNAIGAPFTVHTTIGWPILAAALVLTMVSGIAFGLPSALQTVRINQRRAHLRQSLVGIQAAVSCLLLIASGALARNAISSATVPLAFDYTNMLVIYPELYGRNLATPVVQQKLNALSERFSALPNVKGVTAAVVPPLGGRRIIDSLPGVPHVYRNAVAPSYFTVMGLPILRGRTFLPGERGAVIVSESAARAVWPNQDPLDKRWNLAGADRTVVGIARNSGANLLADADSIEAYVPIEGSDPEQCALILHTPGDPASLVRTIPGSAAAVNETVSVTLMRISRDNAIEAQKRMVMLIGSIGTVATTLAAAGLFALVAFAVAQRKRELGILMALGASPRHILDVLLRQNASPAAAGAVAGVILAVILGRVVRSHIVMQKQDGGDLAGYAIGLAGFALVAILATLSPALRALRIDPSTTLRDE